MLFNSLDFAVFLPLMFVLYWFVTNRNLKLQNLLVLIASYIFYGWWDWKFLLLIVLSTVVDFLIGLGIDSTENKKKQKALLGLSLAVNLGLLGFFKYFNFFADNFRAAFTFFGHSIPESSLNIILPVGISFYTFQTLSYAIDVYRGKLKANRDPIAFAAFVSFFPQLVAGPIERAANLLPQFDKKRVFNQEEARDGMCQILWGLFKKVVIADSCAVYSEMIFNNSEAYSGPALLLGVTLFTIQIYGDFSGYSDIAIGTARLFGFRLMQNFAFPFFSRDIAEYWRRWHISLTTWFRDYLYIPLGGSRGGLKMKIRNTFIIFIVSGFWHGASWNYILWGLLNAVYFLPLLLMGSNRNHIETVAKGKLLPSLSEAVKILFTFLLNVLAFIVFRTENMSHMWQYLTDTVTGFFSKKGYTQALDLVYWKMGHEETWQLPLFMFFFFAVEWLGREGKYGLENTGKKWPTFLRWFLYYGTALSIYFHAGKEQQFIYFQF